MDLNKWIRGISFGVLTLVFLSVFAYSVKHVSTGGKKFRFLTKPLQEFIDFPKTIIQVIGQLKGQRPVNVKRIDESFKPYNSLDYDVYALNPTYESNKFTFYLTNLKTDSVLYEWVYKEKDFNKNELDFIQAPPYHPILLKNRSILGSFYNTKNLFRMNRESEIIWMNSEKSFHHSLNLSYDGNVWTCTRENVYTKNGMENIAILYEDDFITKVDVNTGKILYDKSLFEIFKENGYSNFIHGFGYGDLSSGTDIFHLNDVEPVLNDGKYWKRGDLFLSLCSRSMIVHYRPSTNKIMRLIYGPFLSQHDVDIVSDSTISIFNNNRMQTHKRVGLKRMEEYPVKDSLMGSEIVVYNFADSSFSLPFIQAFKEEKIYTRHQGLHHYLNNGDVYVESNNNAKVFIIREDTVIMKGYVNEIEEGFVQPPYWSRIYEDVNF